VQGTGTIDEFGQTKPNGASGSSFSGSVYTDASGARTLFIHFAFLDVEQNSPPNDQFVATVTDAAGKVTGQAAETGTYRWMAADDCVPGHWEFEGLAN
jgi:hypothetical protein